MGVTGLEWPKWGWNGPSDDVFVPGTSRWERLLYLRRSIKYVCHVADEHRTQV